LRDRATQHHLKYWFPLNSTKSKDSEPRLLKEVGVLDITLSFFFKKPGFYVNRRLPNSKAQTESTEFGEVGASERICYILWEQCSKLSSWSGFWDINVLALAQSLQCKVTRNEGFCDFWLPCDWIFGNINVLFVSPQNFVNLVKYL
jgi:hypothetical protein